MRLLEIPRTSSFRIALLFLLLFGAASVAMFVFIYWQTAGYLVSESDATFARLIATYKALDEPSLIREIDEHWRVDPGRMRPRSVFDASGKWLAGGLDTLPKIPAYDEPFEFAAADIDGNSHPVRAMAHRLPNGEILVVTQDMFDIRKFDSLLARAIALGGALVLVIGFIGAVAMGLGAQRRIDAFTGEIQGIVKGGLVGRLPVLGSSDDIDRLATVVNSMLDEIERLMSEVKGVCDDIAHDLRTPLTRLIAGLERAERRAASGEEFADAIAQAHEEARLLLATFRALLRISEIEDSARRSEFVAVDLNRVARDVVEFFEPIAEEKKITIRIEGGGSPVCVLGDTHMLFDATCNLVDNALKFTQERGEVVVKTACVGREIVLEVRDNGPGIPEDEREAVLRRFYRSERSRHTPGNGLGLSMVAAVAKLHNMALVVEDGSPGCRIFLKGGDLAHAVQAR